ncbi:Scr1 family TA system antitoxin-like transcriptional regulator [Streptomyces collinus]|uniref:Scr1 family TA system antitoxin-like transcriptional regulator n=1 Tax=Streptomyces collinus TaxID=42684 RepID=UPI0033C0884D
MIWADAGVPLPSVSPTPCLCPCRRLELRVAQRIQRQQALERDEAPVDYVAYVHEWALRMQFGACRTTHEQLQHLCEMSERENIGIRGLPVRRRRLSFLRPSRGQPIRLFEVERWIRHEIDRSVAEKRLCS